MRKETGMREYVDASDLKLDAGGCWSQSRPGVFFTTRRDGALDCWDLYFKHQEPTLQVQVCIYCRVESSG